MYKCRMKAYEGSENYIFISYAHKDSEMVLPILDLLSDHGYRVWYDDGIAPGSEWPEYIADHLNRSAITIAFISPNSIASPNCRREITFALSKNKTFLGIQLVPTQMSLGMEMQLSAHQVVFRYNYATEEAFMEKLNSMPELASCQIPHEPEEPETVSASVPSSEVNAPANAAAPASPAAPVIPSPTPVPASIPSAPSVSSAPPISGEDMAAVSRMMNYTSAPQPAMKMPAASQPAVQMQPVSPKVTSSLPPKKKSLILGLGIGIPSLLCIIIAIVLVAVKPWKVSTKVDNIESASPALQSDACVKVDSFTPEVYSYGYSNETLEYKKKDSYLSLYCIYITEDVISMLSKMPEIRYLTFTDCIFVTDFSNLKADSLRSLDIIHCAGLKDFSSVNRLTTLTNLKIENSGANETLSLASFSSLTTLSLNGNPQITSLKGIENTLIKNLSFAGTGVDDISILTALPLSQVTLDNTPVTDINPLCTLTTLTVLSASGCELQPVTEMCLSLGLQTLNIDNCGLEGLSAFDALTRLSSFFASGNSFASAPCFEKSVATLSQIHLDNTPEIDSFLSTLSLCSNVTDLSISNNPSLTDLAFISGMVNLKTLHAENCSITDISALKGKNSLMYVYLQNNQISDVTPLASVSANKMDLELSGNLITDASCLFSTLSFNILRLEDNPLSFASTPEDILGGNKLYISYGEDLLSSPLLPAKKFTSLNIYGAPEDKQLDLKDAGGYTLEFLTEEDEE